MGKRADVTGDNIIDQEVTEGKAPVPEHENALPSSGAETTDENKALDTAPVSDVVEPVPLPSLASITDTHKEAMEKFDPSIHAVNADGTPKTKADGSYAKKRGRKSGQPNARTSAPAASASSLPNANGAEVAPSFEAVAAAKQTCNILINGAVMVLGPEWAPENKGEAESLMFAFRDYYDVRGVPNIPPEIALVAAVAAYSLPRLSKPTVQERAVTVYEKIRAFFRGRNKKRPEDHIEVEGK